MGLFDLIKRDKSYETLNSEELSQRIAAKKHEIDQLKDDIEFAKSENEKLEDNYLQKIKELDEKQAYFTEQIEQQKLSYNSRLEKIQAKTQANKIDYEAKISALNDKIAALENRERELYLQKDEESQKSFKAKEESIKNKIEKLKSDLEAYNDAFNKNVEETAQRYNEFIERKDIELANLNKKKEEFILSANADIEKLESEKAKIESYHSSQLKKLQQEQETVAAIVRAQEESTIKEKEKELASFNSEVNSLHSFRENLLNDLQNSRAAHEREYNLLVSEYEHRKENLLRENELLKAELEDRQRQYDEEANKNKLDYEYQTDELNRLIASLDDKNKSVDKDLKQQFELQESELVRRYYDYVEELEAEYNQENKTRSEIINNLRFELKQEEEKAKNEKEFLDRKLENTSEVFKNSLKEKNDQINLTQNALSELEAKHNEVVKNFVAKIGEIKESNAKLLQDKNREYDGIIADLKAEYAKKREEINEEIAQIKENFEKIRADNTLAQKNLNDLNDQKQKEKQNLIAQQNAYVDDATQVSIEIGKKIDEVKALMAANNQNYNENLDKLNRRKNAIKSEADNKLADLNSEYQTRVSTLKNEHDSNIEKLKLAHTERLNKLNSDYNKQADEINGQIDAKKKELELYSSNAEAIIDSIRSNSQNNIFSLDAQNRHLQERIAAVKDQISSDTENYDRKIKDLENEYLSNIDDMARAHNEQIQKILSEYEIVPSQELDNIKKEYERVQKEYSDNIEAIKNSKIELKDTVSELKNQIKIQKEAFDSEIATKNSEYERIKKDVESQQSQQNEDVTRLQSEVASYEGEKDSEIDELIEEQNNSYDEYVRELSDKYSELEISYRERQNQVQRQLENALRSIKYDADNKIADIDTLIEDIFNDTVVKAKEAIAQINDKLDDVNREHNRFKQQSSTRREAIIATHSDYIDNIRASLAEINQSAEALKQLLIDKQRNYNSEVEKLNLKRKDVQDEYDSAVKEADEVFDVRVSELNENHSQEIREAKEEHRQALAELRDDYEQRANDIKKSYADKKDEYRILKKDYKRDLAAIKQEGEDRLETLDEQRKDLQSSVLNLQKVLEEEKNEYDEQNRLLNAGMRTKIAQLQKAHADTISTIVYEDETVPTQRLNEVKMQLEDAQNNFDNRVLAISRERKDLDESEYSLISRNAEEKNNAESELALKKDEYSRLKDESEKQIVDLDDSLKEKRGELENFTKDIDNLVQQYRDDKESNYQNLANELEEKFTALRNSNSLKEQNVASKYENQISNLQNSISAKIAYVDKKINNIRSKGNKKRKEYETFFAAKNDEYDELIPALQKQLENLIVERENNNLFYADDLKRLDKKNKLAISSQRKKLAEELEQARLKYANEYEDINNNTIDIKKQLDRLVRELAKENSEFEKYRSDSDERNKKIIAEQTEYLNNIAKKKNALEEKIGNIKAEMAEKQKAYNAKMDKLNADYDNAQSIYNNKVAQLEHEYKQKTATLTSTSSEQIHEAGEKHSLVLADLQKQFQERSDAIRKSFEDKKEELRNLKANYKQDIADIKAAIDDKIEELKNQQLELLDKIKDIKTLMKDENDAYIEQSRVLQEEYDGSVKTLNDESRNKIQNIYHSFVEIPNIELQRATNDFNALKAELDDSIKNFDIKKKELDEYEASVIQKYENTKIQENDILDIRREQYENLYNSLKKEEYDFDANLTNRKKELEQLQIDIENSINSIKAEKKAKLDEHSKHLEESYVLQEKHFKELQESTAKRNEFEIVSLQERLDAKAAGIESLIDKINARKKRAEDERSVLYNDALAETNRLQKALDDIVAENALRQAEYESELAAKRENYNATIEKIKAQQASDLEEKKKEFIEIRDARQKEIDDVQQRISELEGQKSLANEKIATYENEKNFGIEILRKDFENFMHNIKNQVEELAIKRNELEESHNHRIVEIKTQIAQAISDYDNLVSLKPSLIADANNEEIDFESVTKQFKKKLDNLERSHDKIMSQLEDARIETLKSINTEIENLENSKPSKLKAYEDEITDLLSTYDTMIRDEQEKQANLNRNIELVNIEKRRVEEDTYRQRTEMDVSYSNREATLNEEFNRKMAETAREYHEISDNYKKEFERLSLKHNSLSQDIVKLNDEFIKIDNDIHNEILKLKAKYNDELVKIQRQYDEKVNADKQKLKTLDVMGGAANLLFKN